MNVKKGKKLYRVWFCVNIYIIQHTNSFSCLVTSKIYCFLTCFPLRMWISTVCDMNTVLTSVLYVVNSGALGFWDRNSFQLLSSVLACCSFWKHKIKPVCILRATEVVPNALCMVPEPLRQQEIIGYWQ